MTKAHSWRGRKKDVRCRHCNLVREYVDGRWIYTMADGSKKHLFEAPACVEKSEVKK